MILAGGAQNPVNALPLKGDAIGRCFRVFGRTGGEGRKRLPEPRRTTHP